jgi:hypothetical protein
LAGEGAIRKLKYILGEKIMVKYLTFGLVACGIASIANATDHISCSQEIGKDNASVYVNQCIQISPATHPPCNDQNSCAMIKDEIKRGCEFVKNSPGIPKFCEEYSQQTPPPIPTAPTVAKDCVKSTKIPTISGTKYLEARSTLITSGWKPVRVLLSAKSDPETYTSVSNLIDNGVFEYGKCSEKAKTCEFVLRDEFRNLLIVVASTGFDHTVYRTEFGCMSEIKEWDERASKVTKGVVFANSNYLAQQIQNATHPTGNTPTLSGVTVAKYDDHISAEIAVEWHGGFSNAAYKTTVAWNINKTGHISTTIKADTATFAVAPDNLARLNNFFKAEVYPLVRQTLEE